MTGVPFAEFGVKWFEDIVATVTEWFRGELVDRLAAASVSIFETPVPSGEGVTRVVGAPRGDDGVWPEIYAATVGGESMLIGLVILYVAVQLRHVIRIFNFGNVYAARAARRSAWTGGFLIVTWYWTATTALSLVQALTIGLLPDIGEVGAALIAVLPEAAGSPGLTVVMAMVGGLSMVFLEAVFFIRRVLLYVYLYGMPVGVAIGYGNIPVLSGIARRLIAQFIPLAVLPLPAAVLYRGYALLFAGETHFPLESDFLRYLVVIALPVVAVYVTWMTFRYACPIAARTIAAGGRGAIFAGTAATTGSLTLPATASRLTTNRDTPASNHASAHRPTGPRGGQQPSGNRGAAAPEGGSTGDSSRGGSGVPAYRRSENDPTYY